MNKQRAKYKISPKGKRKLDYPSKSSKPSVKLPLVGKTIYLDVKESKQLKQLKEDLKKLGATLEDFVSRDINYLITSQPRPRKKVANPGGDDSPTPSPFNCDPSPSPGYQEDKIVTSVTRGKALLEKARYTRQASTLLDNAEKWGVKIVSIEGAFKWIEIELKKLPRSSRHVPKKSKSQCVSSYKLCKSPYVKLETDSFCYRPFYVELEVWPRLNVDTPRGSCPFDGTLIKSGDESREERGELLAAQVDIPSEDTPNEEKDVYDSADSTTKPLVDIKKSESDGGDSRILTAGELKRRKELKKKQERKRGYCECCHVKYEDLDKHVKEEQHRQYVKTKTNYNQLDALIQSGPNTQHFLYEYLTKAAQLRNKRYDSENCVRRSPRKAKPDSPCNVNSPCKLRNQGIIQSPKKAHIPGKTESTHHRQSVRVSPRKDLSVKRDKSVDGPKLLDFHVLEKNHSDVVKTSRISDTKRKEEFANLNRVIRDEGIVGKENISPCIQKMELDYTHMKNSSHSDEKLNRNDNRKTQNTVNSSPRKYAKETVTVNAKNLVDELRGEPVSDSNEKAVLEEFSVDDYELIRRGFADLVHYGKKRIEVEQSSDDFEVCFARCLPETLPIPNNASEKAVEKTFDQMVQLCEKTSIGRVSSKHDLDITVNMIRSSLEKDSNNAENDKCLKGKVSKSSTDLDVKEEVPKGKVGNDGDMYDFSMDSDIPSDFQCYDEEGNVVRFSKTLAERIKERSLGRRSSVESYNVNALFQLPSRSPSNSLSSNKSDRVSTQEHQPKLKKGVNSILKKKTIGSIASAKVVNKYRNKMFAKVQNENTFNGYQGDDENENTPNLTQNKLGQKIQKCKFWYYEPVVENKKSQELNKKLSGLQKELHELEAASSWFSNDIYDSDHDRSRMKSSKLESTLSTSDMTTSKYIMKGKGVGISNSSQGCGKQCDGIKIIESTCKKRKNNIRNKTRDGSEDIHVTSNIAIGHSRKKSVSKELHNLKHNSTDYEVNSGRRNRKAKNRSKMVGDLLEKSSSVQENSGFLIPNELIDAWNTGVTLDRSVRRKNNKTYIDYDSDYTSDDLCKNTSGKTTNGSLKKLSEASNENEMSNKRLSSRTKVRRRFWEFISVATDETDGINENIPQILRDSWNTGVTLDRHERRKNRKSEVTASKTNENTACSSKDKEMIKENQNKKGETGAEFVESENGRNKRDQDVIEHKTVLKAAKYCEAYNGSSDTSGTETKILREKGKKTFISHNVRKKERVNYNERESRQSSCYPDYSCGVSVKVQQKGCKTKSSKQKNEIEEMKCSLTEYAEQKTERSRSKTRKVVQCQKMHANVSKSLPKELQLLQDTWNDLNTVHKRSRSSQSGSVDVNKTYDKSLRKCEISGQRQISYDMIVDEEILSLTNSRATFISEKDKNKVGASLIQNEDDNGRSKSPVFRLAKQNMFQLERRKSPVFDRSPRQVHKPEVKSLQNNVKRSEQNFPLYNVNGICNRQVKGLNVKTDNDLSGSVVESFIEINEGCTSKSVEEVEIHMGKQEPKLINMTKCSGKSLETEERCALLKKSGSRFNNTSREEKLKHMKRKNTESACPGAKKRKVEIYLTNNTPRRRLLQVQSEDNTSQKANCTEIIDNSKEKNINERITDDQFPLIWKPIGSDKKKGNCEKVKLNRSWTLLSERSISKLLSSEDDIENFDGFTDEDKLPSDMSYEEQCEVEFPKDDQHEWVVGDIDKESDVEENLVRYVPAFFPSPDKASNSSWNDAIEGYIENSVNHGPTCNSSFKAGSSSVDFSFTGSPRSPSRQDCVSPIPGNGQILSHRKLRSPERAIAITPKSVKNENVERVDAEIEFNFGSPQKNRSDFSPLRSVNGVVRNLSITPNKTSTPVLKKVNFRNIRSTK